jgi:hypothetical protein
MPVPAALDFRERAVVRFLDERFIDPADILDVAAELTRILP